MFTRPPCPEPRPGRLSLGLLRPGTPSPRSAASGVLGDRGCTSTSPTSSRSGRLRPNSRPDEELWRGVPIPRSRDVRLLMPPSLPRGRRFETKNDARTRNRQHIEILCEREPTIAEAIDECCSEAPPLGLVGCAVCGRCYRIYSASELLRVGNRYVGPHQLATVYLDEIEAGSLSTVSI